MKYGWDQPHWSDAVCGRGFTVRELLWWNVRLAPTSLMRFWLAGGEV